MCDKGRNVAPLLTVLLYAYDVARGCKVVQLTLIMTCFTPEYIVSSSLVYVQVRLLPCSCCPVAAAGLADTVEAAPAAGGPKPEQIMLGVVMTAFTC
jgi:hypothetical protein